jgi:hypothetical protein
MMKAASTSEMLTNFHQTNRHNILEDTSFPIRDAKCTSLIYHIAYYKANASYN